ncbi:MAG: MucBP domain-containing protein, partial [Actinomycetia bacterium]|nr:MucBP domain-containing protein [Actinomycetes bacterium]
CLVFGTAFVLPLSSAQAVPNPNLLNNPSFETNPWAGLAAASRTILATDLGWNSNDPGNATVPAHSLEIWGPGTFTPGRPGTVGGTPVTFTPSDGQFLCELNTTAKTQIWQDVATTTGALYFWGVDHKGRIGNAADPDIMQVTLGGTLQTGRQVSKTDGTIISTGTTQFATPRGRWDAISGYYTATSATTRYSLESVHSGSGAVGTQGVQPSQPGEGNLVDNCKFNMIVASTEQTITAGSPAPATSTLTQSLQDGYTAEPASPLPSVYDTPGDYNILMNIFDSNGNQVGQITSVIHVLAVYSLTVKFVDAAGNELEPSVVTTHTAGDAYTVGPYTIGQQLTINGTLYIYKGLFEGSDPLSGTMDADMTVMLMLEPVTYTVTVRNVDQNGNDILPPKVGVYPAGSPYVVWAMPPIIVVGGKTYVFKAVDPSSDLLSGTVDSDKMIIFIWELQATPKPPAPKPKPPTPLALPGTKDAPFMKGFAMAGALLLAGICAVALAPTRRRRGQRRS